MGDDGAGHNKIVMLDHNLRFDKTVSNIGFFGCALSPDQTS
jgi:hypothetical protein